ncbi:CsbD family protein [Iamia majanohamensis]|uniref:CsbD family protein n=1 Tax=Iamia majanohamensis TaxID=467976 RepID=A0AAE9Y3D8_9ACTN|nr:CsbD family protein [Iamia majanohamensis]WCO65239.1 CsbD family protein [Iamia majanohamensis]
MAKDDKADDLVGKVEEKVGWLTGDREAEAKGKLRRLDPDHGHHEDESEEAEAEAADAAQRAVRAEEYGEYDPDVDGATPAADVRPADTEP